MSHRLHSGMSFYCFRTRIVILNFDFVQLHSCVAIGSSKCSFEPKLGLVGARGKVKMRGTKIEKENKIGKYHFSLCRLNKTILTP